MPVQDISNLMGKLSEMSKEDISVLFKPSIKYKSPSNNFLYV